MPLADPDLVRSAGFLVLLGAACVEVPGEVGPLAQHSEQTASVCFSADPKLDLLFVIDDSASMAAEAVTLAEEIERFAALLLEPSVCPLDLRIGVTTTSRGGETCPGEPGALVPSSCRARLHSFVSDDGVDGPAADVRQPACADVCPFATLELSATIVEHDDDLMPRPWLQWGLDTNLPAGVGLADAMRCWIPQGVAGCPEESPLEAMRAALLRSGDQNDPAYGFVRDDASLFVVIVTDEDDAGVRPEKEYVELLRAIAEQKADRGHGVVLTALTGVSEGYETGVGGALGCMREEALATAPTRIVSLFDGFAAAGGSTWLTSICGPDWAVVLAPLFGSIRDTLRPLCVPFCAEDADPDTDEVLDPACVVTETESKVAEDGLTVESRPIPPCIGDGADEIIPPPGADACIVYLTGDEMDQSCIDEGWNLQAQIIRTGPRGPRGDRCLEITCSASLQQEIDCPNL